MARAVSNNSDPPGNDSKSQLRWVNMVNTWRAGITELKDSGIVGEPGINTAGSGHYQVI